ncbi:MAG TPA: class I SAM-dependent methyltransferase [Thermoanaerobaculia bacterium]|nr:class I SAM-dependent methyltransferase [Thermoanaerobaculia bacterium]
MSFKDHFSGHAGSYASFRPSYPPEVFDFVAALPQRRGLVWDCATGNGQAALDLAERFDRVVATDASAEQLEHATPHPRVEYRQALAERSGLADGSVDLVTVATAVHWFDFDRFYAEVERVLAPGGALAVWAYDLVRISPELDALVDRLGHEIVAPYWPPERRWVDELYRTLPFPFDEVAVPPLWIEDRWNLERLLQYAGTWSATQRYIRETGSDPRELVRTELEAAWGDPTVEKTLRWPLMMRAGRPRKRYEK